MLAHSGESIMVNLFRVLVLSTFLLPKLVHAELDGATESEIETCRQLKVFLDGNVGEVECQSEYQIYSKFVGKYSRSKVKSKYNQVRIAAFNLFKPGATQTEYKDHQLVAQIIDHWDVVAAVELTSNNGLSKRHNEGIVEYYTSRLAQMTEQGADLSASVTRNELALIREQFDFPGYIEVLKELQKLDASWSLVLSGKQEGSENSTVKELTGFYYRSSVVDLKATQYCRDKYGRNGKYGCLPVLDEKTFGRDVDGLFSRRPFLATFESGEFDFTLLSTHVIHNTPSDEDLQKKILRNVYGVEDYKDIGPGVTQLKFARFAEVRLMAELVEYLKKSYYEQDYIILGDFNLESTNDYWETFFNDFRGLELKIEGATSMALGKSLSDGTITHGTKSNYDHFLFDPNETRNCKGSNTAKIFNFIEGDFSKLINRRYLVRSNAKYQSQTRDVEMYRLKAGGREKVENLVDNYTRSIQNKLTVKNNKLVPRFDMEESQKEFYDRVIDSQLFDKTYYNYLKEVISDHLPIYMNCSNQYDND